MQDTQFMSAAEKMKVLRQWELFLKSGCTWEKFTKALYEHLHLHCSFIAHYDRAGFYSTYFESGDDMAHFLSQFDQRQAQACGIPLSIEYGMTYWATGDYADINMAMIQVASKYIPQLTEIAQNHQKDVDVARAMALFKKHGLTADITGS